MPDYARINLNRFLGEGNAKEVKGVVYAATARPVKLSARARFAHHHGA
jgi:hypothetical protein